MTEGSSLLIFQDQNHLNVSRILMVSKLLLVMHMKVSPCQLHSINSRKFKFNATSTLDLLLGRHTGTAASVVDVAA